MPGHWNPIKLFQSGKFALVREIQSDKLQNELLFTANKEKCLKKIFDKIANMLDSYECKNEENADSEKTLLMHKILENNFFQYLISSGDIGEKECLQMAQKLTAFIMDILRESTSNIESNKYQKSNNEKDNSIGGNDCFGFKKLPGDKKDDGNSCLELENVYEIEVEKIKDLQKAEIVPSGITFRLETEKESVEIEKAMKGGEGVTIVRKEMKCENKLPNQKQFSTWLIKTVDQRMEPNRTKSYFNKSDLDKFQNLKHSEKSEISNRLNFESDSESQVISQSNCDKRKLENTSNKALSCKSPNKYCEELDLYIKNFINLNESHKQRIDKLYNNLDKFHKKPTNVPFVSKYNLPHEKEIEQLKPPVDCHNGTPSKFYRHYSYLIQNLLSLVYK